MRRGGWLFNNKPRLDALIGDNNRPILPVLHGDPHVGDITSACLPRPNRKDDPMIPKSLPRSFMKLVLSAAVAATLAASPVHARENARGDDNTAIIAALLGLVTLGVLLSGSDDEPSKPYGYVSRPHKPTPPQRVSKYRALPASCLREYRTQTGRKIMFGNRCLKKNFKYAHRLPSACERNLIAKNRKGIYVTRQGYKPSCLSKHGYRAVRRY